MRLGQCLREDFNWDECSIERAERDRNQDNTPAPIGSYYRRNAPKGNERDVTLALLLLRQSDAARHAATFDVTEYEQLGDLFQFEREDITKKGRAYAAMMTALLLYVAYPLNVIVTTSSTLTQWTGVFIIYAILGLAFVAASMFIGDNAIKAYGVFLKRRVRISRSRAAIRHQAQRAGATVTMMPNRRAKTDDGERPDPEEFTGLQKWLPLAYSFWSFLKLSLMFYFVACLFEGSLSVTAKSMKYSLAVVLVVFPVWAFFVSAMCERYHKYLKEACRISLERPFPRCSTTHLRTDANHRNLCKVGAILFVGLWVAVVAVAVFVLLSRNPSWDPITWGALALGALLSAILFAVRVWQTLYRMRNSMMLP